MAEIIGRKAEQAELLRIFNRRQAQLVAVYGRRRVGKTFLVRELLKEHFVFYHTGISPLELEGRNLLDAQLTAFASTLAYSGASVSGRPKNWTEAFQWLRNFLVEQDPQKRMVVFIDEMPWMDTPRSGFISAFEHFWNGWGAGQDNLMMIVCGSATSWFFLSKGFSLSRYDIAQAYMAVGGIPYYLSYFQPGKSLAQIIDNLFFERKAKLQNEFERLFNSIFTSPERFKTIVRLLAKRHIGYSRDEISKSTGIPTGKDLSKTLKTLEASDFIIKYKPFENDGKHLAYRLVDHFCLFYLRFVDGSSRPSDYWQRHENAPGINSWRGIAFEEVCLSHLPQLKSALGISGVGVDASPWTLRGVEEQEGMQIDLILERQDRVVNLCEMKFSVGEYDVDKAYEMKLRGRLQTIQQMINRRQNVQMTLVTTFGLKHGVHSGIFQQTVCIDDLFQ